MVLSSSRSSRWELITDIMSHDLSDIASFTSPPNCQHTYKNRKSLPKNIIIPYIFCKTFILFSCSIVTGRGFSLCSVSLLIIFSILNCIQPSLYNNKSIFLFIIYFRTLLCPPAMSIYYCCQPFYPTPYPRLSKTDLKPFLSHPLITHKPLPHIFLTTHNTHALVHYPFSIITNPCPHNNDVTKHQSVTF